VCIVNFLLWIMLKAAIGVSSVKGLYMDHVVCCMILIISNITITLISVTTVIL
jgi:hypothetical protein